ncbi:MAG: carboxylating nicotinate-nucleotide diphosphorylase, partial [Candidatus Hydrothermarchaeaceae archaeon]
SGIATATRKLADICEEYDVRVAGTRKTTPGFRYFEKKAMTHGGGEQHRMGLDDAILIKDNHVAIVGLVESIKKAKMTHPGMRIEVEVSSLDGASRACKAGADVVMLDNMSVGDAANVIEGLEKSGLRRDVLVEISGGVTPDNIEEYAKLRPDVISSGYLTAKAEWLDMSLKVRGQN